jgi:hypothetical protein
MQNAVIFGILEGNEANVVMESFSRSPGENFFACNIPEQQFLIGSNHKQSRTFSNVLNFTLRKVLGF